MLRACRGHVFFLVCVYSSMGSAREWEEVLQEVREPVGGGSSVPVGVLAHRDGRGMVKSTGLALGASGVAGAGGPSLSISTSASPSREEAVSSSDWGWDSWRGGGICQALHSLEKASWSQPQLGQWGGEVGQQEEMGFSYPLLGQVGFWQR